MAKREWLQLSHSLDLKKHKIKGWFVSPKLDGMRALWDGGISRGLLASQVPWANTTKDDRYEQPLYSTGLWSRYGKTIQAPNWFLDKLPNHPADGELWAGVGKFQYTMSTVKQLNPDERWNAIQYKIFDVPTYRQVFEDGEIKNKKKYEKVFKGILPWITKRGGVDTPTLQFMDIVQKYGDIMHEQKVLVDLEQQLKEVLDAGGEGLILRDPRSIWTPARVWSSLKYKPWHDSEAVVVGYTWGRETEEGSKLLGKMGAMIVEWKGKQFKLSGFTDEERVMNESREDCPGEVVAPNYTNTRFSRGSTVTFKYRELTDEGIPKESRFLRERED